MNLLEKLKVPPRTTFNVGFGSAGNAYMLALFGHPVLEGRYDAAGKCTPVNNPEFKTKITTASVGPFRVTGLKPAVASLKEIFARVQAEVPELYAILGSAGMQCARFTKIRRPDGTLRIGPGISNHSWGTALDIKLAGVLDRQGDSSTQRGLFILSSYFNAAGWYWGAAFPTEDAMHFEVSKSLLEKWRKEGMV